MPKAGDAVIQQCCCDIEHEKLFLPSDFSSPMRDTLELTLLGGEEAKLREGEAFDALHLVRTAAKTVVALRDRKNKHSRGQAENTRSGTLIRNAEGQRDLHMQSYAFARHSMIALRFLDAEDRHSPFPPLTLEDTFMKSRQRKRTVGDSRRADGLIWHMGSITSGSGTPLLSTPTPTGAGEVPEDEISIGTLYLIFLMPCHL